MTDNNINPYSTAVTKQVKDSINYHFNALVEVPSNEVNVLPENIFVQVFLPYFCGEKILTDDPSILTNWISISGSPAKEVLIIDSEMNPLFKVPALTDTSIIDVDNENKGQPFFNILMNYELHKNQLPIIGENYLNKAIDSRIQTLEMSSKDYLSNEKQWKEIFIRYGKLKATQSDLAIDNSKISQDEIEYD